jgi:hypothetical protein
MCEISLHVPAHTAHRCMCAQWVTPTRITTDGTIREKPFDSFMHVVPQTSKRMPIPRKSQLMPKGSTASCGEKRRSEICAFCHPR